MDVNDDGSGGSNTNPGGEGDNSQSKSGTVSRDAYDRSVTSEKNLRKQNETLQARLNQFEAEKAELENKKLLDEKNYKELVDKQKKQIDELTGSNKTLLEQRDNTRKLTSFVGLMQEKGLSMEPKYFELVPIDSIKINNDGTIDHTSVAEAVKNFQTEHPKLLAQPTTFPPNGKTGNGPGKKMSMAEWQQLPYAEKEKAWKEDRVEKPAAMKR